MSQGHDDWPHDDPLMKHLVGYGWQEDDMILVVDSYYRGGIDAAVHEIRWMDDDEHDYSSELRECILKFGQLQTENEHGQ